MLAKEVIEVRGVGKPQRLGYIRNQLVGMPQQLLGFLRDTRRQVGTGRAAGCFAQHPAQVVEVPAQARRTRANSASSSRRNWGAGRRGVGEQPAVGLHAQGLVQQQVYLRPQQVGLIAVSGAHLRQHLLEQVRQESRLLFGK